MDWKKEIRCSKHVFEKDIRWNVRHRYRDDFFLCLNKPQFTSQLPYMYVYKFYFGVNSFWVIQKNKPVNDALIKLVVEKCVSIYIFLILYTNILQNKLIKILNFVTDFPFKGKTQNKMSINNYGIANWCKSCRYFVFDTNPLTKSCWISS